jgi:hypothetical protein
VTFPRMLNEDRQGGSSAPSGDVKINPAEGRMNRIERGSARSTV